MPLSEYGALAGRIVDLHAEGGGDTPHFQLLVAAGAQHRVAVNVLSALAPSELMFLADEAFDHPLLAGLEQLPDGFTAVPSAAGGLALDYIRGNLFDPTAMRPMPATAPGADNDLSDRLEHFARRAMSDASARVFAFGERWGPQAQPDKVFGFQPGAGVHDIHMNQGNAGRFERDDGVWQDGGLLLHFPGAEQWVGIFLAFQSQAWHTDDSTGHALATSEDAAAGTVRIAAALVNPEGPAPEAETVTLINASPAEVDLSGWALVDRVKSATPLSGRLAAGEAMRVAVRPPFALGNSGGLITLLDPAGQKVDGVSYTGGDVREGWTLVF